MSEQRDAPTTPPAAVEAGPGGSDESRRRGLNWRGALAPRWYGFYILIAMLIGFGLALPETFLTMENLRALATNQALGAILAVALILPFAGGVYDLSVASVMTLASVVAAGMFSSYESSVFLAVAAAVLVGVSIGLLNGLFVAFAKIDSLVVTLATGSIALGTADWITNGTIFSSHIPSSFQDIGQAQPGGIPLPIIYMVVIAFVVWWVLERRPVGRYLYAMGDNPEAARLTGLRTNRLIVGAFCASGLLAGIAGVILAAQTGSGNPTIGASYLLPAFASAFLGATIFRLGHYNVVGTIVAVFIVAVGLAGLVQLGVPFFIQPVFSGAVLLIAVGLTRLRDLRLNIRLFSQRS